MTNYPAQLDNIITLPTAIDNATPVRGNVVNRLRDAILAIENTLGVNPAASYTTVKTRLDSLENIVGNLQIIELAQDLGGTLEQPLVIGIQGRPVSNVTPNVGDLLIWNGIAWIPKPSSLISSLSAKEFLLSGAYSSASLPGTFDPPFLTDSPSTVTHVSMIRRTAGSSGVTKVDILKNGASIFIHDADKPQVNAGAGNYAISIVDVFVGGVLTLVPGDILEAVLQSAETYAAGPPEGPEGLCVKIYFT